MWELTKETKAEIEALYQHFLPIITEVSKEELYDRLYGGYCYGEGIIPLISIDIWESVFGLRDDFPKNSVFESWEDYRKYNGDWHIKAKYLKR